MPSSSRSSPSGDIGARLDRVPVSRFHFVLLGIAAVSLLFDGLDGVVDSILIAGAIVVVVFGPPTRGRRLEDTSRPGS